MNRKQRNFIAYSACGVALTILFAVTKFDSTSANTNALPNRNVPNLAGTWQINRKKSDDPQDKLSEAKRGAHGGGLRGRQSSGSAEGLPVGDGNSRGVPH